VNKVKLFRGLSGLFVAIMIAAIFGYNVGRDMALRDNAREALVASTRAQ